MSSLFVASLGNPAPYTETLHSAGHILLRALATTLQAPYFNLNPALGDGLTTEATLRNEQRTRVTLWQSPSFMNESGPALVQAYRAWLKEHKHDIADSLLMPPKTIRDMTPGNMVWGMRENPELYRPRLRLVLVHDELEAVPGKFKVMYGGAERSAKGHRGVISVVDTLVKKGLLSQPDESVNWDVKKVEKKPKKLSKKAQKALAAKEAEEKAAKEAEAEERRKAGIPDPEPKPEPPLEETSEYKKVQRVIDHPLLTRVQIGIGRPVERDASTVAAFVLSPMEGRQYIRTQAHGETLENFLQKMVAL